MTLRERAQAFVDEMRLRADDAGRGAGLINELLALLPDSTTEEEKRAFSEVLAWAEAGINELGGDAADVEWLRITERVAIRMGVTLRYAVIPQEPKTDG